MTVSNPHDHFFRATFARPEVAAEFARHYLPPPIVAHLDLTTLRPVKASYVDEELRDHVTDLLYQVRLQDGNLAYVYLLFEHKSYPDRWVAFQLLRYMVRIWEHARQQASGADLPPILPLVIYHGEQQWRIDTRFQELVTTPPALAEYVPDFRYALYDLSTYSDAELVGAVSVQIPLWAMKHIYDTDWETTLPKLMALLQALAQAESGLTFVETVLRYISAAAGSLEHDKLKHALEENLPHDGGALMQTIAQQWIEEGIEEGMEKGMEIGLQKGQEHGAIHATREAIFELLDVRFGEISPSVAATLAEIQDLPRLKALHRQAAVAETLEEFKSELG